MEFTLVQPQQFHQIINPPNSMFKPFISLSKFYLKPKTRLTKKLQPFCKITPSELVIKSSNGKPKCNSKENIQLIKEKWLASLTNNDVVNEEIGKNNGGEFKWVIGVDPDVSGALAVLKSDVSGITSAQVFDAPFVQVPVGNRLRKRLDARSIVQLVQSFGAPNGTIAYLEQSIPFPRDGKQGWWSGGFGYGLWIGILVSSGFSVVPVPSSVWKKELELVRGRANKDDSRELARELFPSLSSMLKRKKDHGRAEALLIAAYGKGHMIKPDMLEKLDQESSEAVNEMVIVDSDQSLAICN